jgi:small subunit ribosomal protein S8
MAVDLLSDALNKIKLYDRAGKPTCEVKFSTLLKAVLTQLEANGYIEGFEYVEDYKGGKLVVKLNGKIKELKAIKPRQPVKKDEWYVIEAKFLPAVGYGKLIVSTPQGVMTNEEARKRRIGGRLLAFVY